MVADDDGGVIMMAAVDGGATMVEAAVAEGLLCGCVWEKSAQEQLLIRGRSGALFFDWMSTFLLA